MPLRRDHFNKSTKQLLAQRVAYRCSNPQCRTLTIGSNSTGGTAVLGVASHICTAAPGGPRYDATMTPAQRSHADNGVWMCRQCGKLIDSDTKYTVDVLHSWRRKSEEATVREIQTRKIVIPAEAAPMLEDMDGNAIALAQPAADLSMPARIHAASITDVAKFEKLDTWPKHAVILDLKAEDKRANSGGPAGRWKKHWLRPPMPIRSSRWSRSKGCRASLIPTT